MNRELIQTAEKYSAARKHKRVWRRVAGVLSCFIALCTASALMLPALTMEGETFCGREAHEHSEECFSRTQTVSEPICSTASLGLHIHDETCYAADGTLICTRADALAHTHTESCRLSDGTLWCTLPEIAAHVHTGECYLPAVEGHTHSEACYAAVQGPLLCQLTEDENHTHSESCYAVEQQLICQREETPPQEAVLICPLPEVTPHVHTEACFRTEEITLDQPQLICGLEEHRHQLICHSDKTADVESPAVWEATLPDRLCGEWARDLTAVAESQLGYRESERNFTVLADGETALGYTRYGHWYGSRYGDWCAMFAAFCLHYAGIGESAMPRDANCGVWVEHLQERGLFRSAAQYTPQPGDLIFFDYNASGQADHVGIVTAVEDGRLTAIEGNHGRAVDTFRYQLSNSDILGYGALVDPGMTVMLQQTLHAAVFTDASYAVAAQDGTVITVSGQLPEGAEVRAYPVALESSLINGEVLLCAYDITVFDADGGVFTPAEDSSPLEVTICPPGWAESRSDDESYTVYHIPPQGPPEAMDTQSGREAVSFTTDHFSTYALTSGGSEDAVYLNGSAGSDSSDGSLAAPVKTAEKAMSLVRDGGTVYITGTVTVGDSQSWLFSAGGSVTFRRHSSFTGPLVTVANGGALTVGSGMTLHGGSDGPTYSDSTPSIATCSTYAAGSAKAPLIVVETGGELTLQEGALLQYNANVPDGDGSALRENGYVGMGGAVYCSGTVAMNGGTIQYCEAQCGGGVYVENGRFYLCGGLIEHNFARDIVSAANRGGNFHKNAGGGVYVGDRAAMTMNGGTVANNQSAREGGGIALGWTDRSHGSAVASCLTTFTMNGGTLTGNYAVSTGGGLQVSAGRQAFLFAGSISGNTAAGQEYQESTDALNGSAFASVCSGGGIYVSAPQWSTYPDSPSGVPGKAAILRLLLTDNSAAQGGGIALTDAAQCLLYDAAEGDGTLICGNEGSEILHAGGTLTLCDTALGGISYGWSGASPYTNTLSAADSAVSEAQALAGMHITGNSAAQGGGIGCGGLLELGGEKADSTYLTVEKCWADQADHPPYVTLQLLQDGSAYGSPFRLCSTTDENGSECWPVYYVGGLPAGHSYCAAVQAIDGYVSVSEQTANALQIISRPADFGTVVRWVGDTAAQRPSALSVQLLCNGEVCDTVTLSAENGWAWYWDDLPQEDSSGEPCVYSAAQLQIPDGYYNTDSGLPEGSTQTITNRRIPRISLSAEVRFDDSLQVPDSVALQLLYNGEPYAAARTLSAEDGWTCLWTDLPAVDENGRAVTYTVQQQAVPGCCAQVELSESDDGTACFLVTNLPAATTVVHFALYSTAADAEGLPLLIAGAELTLYQAAEDGTAIAGTGMTWAPLHTWTTQSALGENGGIQTLTLEEGTYCLSQSKAPAGHLLLSAPLVFTAAEGSVAQLTEEMTVNDDGSVTLSLYNALLYELPETGGPGTAHLTASGLILLCIAAALLYSRRQRSTYVPSRNKEAGARSRDKI